MQMSRFIYIRRKWEKDETRIGKLLNYLGKHSVTQPYQIVLFPEGTNLTPDTRKKSKAFEVANNLKPLNNLLQPRTTGFTYIVQKMRESTTAALKIDSIDVFTHCVFTRWRAASHL